MASVTTRILAGFEDPTFGPEQREALLSTGSSDTVFLTWHCLYFHNLGAPHWTSEKQGVWYSKQLRAVGEQLGIIE